MTFNLDNFFNNLPTLNIPDTQAISPGYLKSSFDTIIQKSARLQSVKQSKLSDYAPLEQDPNFSKKAVQPQLELAMGQFGMSTQLAQLSRFQGQTLNIREYIPQSFFTTYLNYSSLIGTNINIMAASQQSSNVQSLSNSFGSDIINGFKVGNFSLSDILSIGQLIANFFTQKPTFTNTSITAILSSVIGDFIPGLSGILTSDDYLQTVSDLSLDDSFTASLQSFCDNLDTMQVSSLVTPSTYDTPLALDDPFGFGLQNTFRDEIIATYQSQLQAAIPSNYADFSEIFAANFATILDDTLISKGLPSIGIVTKAAENNISNQLSNTMVNTFNNVVMPSILSSLGIITSALDTSIQPIDHLYNLHRNIIAREKALAQGDSFDVFSQLDIYFKSLLGTNYTDADIQKIKLRLG